ncbi:MAG: hypothetical protein JXA20_05550 [Spirochaetes bacterium]|nr:hypothetical protein [Spirochaetota bacterium]
MLIAFEYDEAKTIHVDGKLYHELPKCIFCGAEVPHNVREQCQEYKYKDNPEFKKMMRWYEGKDSNNYEGIPSRCMFIKKNGERCKNCLLEMSPPDFENDYSKNPNRYCRVHDK